MQLVSRSPRIAGVVYTSIMCSQNVTEINIGLCFINIYLVKYILGISHVRPRGVGMT